MGPDVKLPSGAVIKISTTPFEVSRDLFQAVSKELNTLKIAGAAQVDLFKHLFCVGVSSKEIEARLWECFKYVQYCDKRGELKIDKDTFEPLSAREDYLTVCMEVTKANVGPFVKRLYAEFGPLLEMMKNDAPA